MAVSHREDTIALACDFVLAAPPSGGYVPAMTDVADRLAAALTDRFSILGRTMAAIVLRP